MTGQMLRDLFHPDYDRRLWHLTRSADPVVSGETTGARGLLQSMSGIAADTAGGEFRPALRTLLGDGIHRQTKSILATPEHCFGEKGHRHAIPGLRQKLP